MKRAQVESYSFLIGILITVAIIAVLGVMLSNYFSGAEERKAAQAKDDLVNISGFYRKCVDNGKDNCICGSFDVGKLRQLDKRLFLNKQLGQSHLILTKSYDVVPDSEGLIRDDDILEKVSFNSELVCTSNYEDSAAKETSHRSYDLTNSYSDRITVVKAGSKLCVAYPQKMELFRSDFASCDAVLPSDRLVLLDSADDASSRQISEVLLQRLVDKVGRVNAFFKAEGKKRQEWFDLVYAKEKEPLAGKAFMVYVSTSAGETSESKDRIVVHYLQGSAVSEAFAKALVIELGSLDGRYYYNSAGESAAGAVSESYRFNVDVYAEANNLTSPDGVYLVCEKNDLSICKESSQVPAVFIEVVDVVNGFSAYQGHEAILAERIMLGVSDYVKGPQVYEAKPTPSEERLFK